MARIPEIIRRNPISQVAPQAPRAGQGWAALADLAQMAEDFVRPAAKDEARRKGEKSVYRDETGALKVDERSLYSGEMGAIQNQAAYAKYLGQKQIDLNTTMNELAVKYEYDPAGFQEASKVYAKTIREDVNVPDVLKEDIVRSIEEGSSRQFNGLYRQQVDRTYKEADKQTATARDMLLDDYVSLYVEGDEEAAAAKWTEIEQLSRMRANAPYISETPAETEAMLRGARGTAKAARLLRDLSDLEGADQITDDQRKELQEVIKDPDIAPGTRQKLYSATQGRLKSIDAAGIVKNMTNDSYEAMVVRAESGGKNNAKATTSSAYGPHQFLKGTWAGLVKKYKPDWARGLSEGQIQAMRGDRAASDEMFGHFRRENQQVLAAAGMPINPATEYMAHFFGAGTATKVLAAGADTPLSDVVSHATIKANGFLKGMTTRDARNWAARKMTMKGSDLARMSVQIDQIEDPEVRRMASQGLNERIEVRRNIEDAAANVFEERINTGDLSVTSQEIAENHDLSTDAQVKLTGALEKANKKSDDMRAVVTRMNDPDAVFDPLDTKDRNSVNSVYEAVIGDAPAASEKGVQAAAQIAKNTGIIPKAASNSIRAAVKSEDPELLGQSMEILSQLKDAAGGSLASVVGAKGLEDALSDFQFYGEFGDRNQAAEQMIKNREKKPKNVTDEAKEAAKNLSISDVTDRFDQSWFSTPKVGDSRAGAGSVPLLTANQEGEMMAEYTRLFKDAYVDTGDSDISQNRALDQMDRIYGMNEVSGLGRVMKYPPQKLYPAVSGSHDWMTDQLLSDVNEMFQFNSDKSGVVDGTLGGEVLLPDGRGDEAMMPDGTRIKVETNGDLLGGPSTKRIRRDDIALWSDDTTAREARSGRPPSYVVYAFRDGVLEKMQQRFVFDPSAAKASARRQFEGDRGDAVAKQQVRDERVKTQQELTGGILDRFNEE